MQKLINAALAPLKRRIMLMVGNAVITAINTGGQTMKAQINSLADTTLADVEFWQNFGFTSNPPKGSRALFVSVGGNQDNPIIISTENGEFRVKNLKEGESCVYSMHGGKLHFMEGDTAVLESAKMQMNFAESLDVDCPKTEYTGALKADELSDVKGTLEQLRQFVNTHTHISAPPSSPTTPPTPPNPIQ
jgi:phage baseplate assembly protein V